MPYPADRDADMELQSVECPEVTSAIAAIAKQGKLYPFLKYFTNLFWKPPVQEI